MKDLYERLTQERGDVVEEPEQETFKAGLNKLKGLSDRLNKKPA